MMHFEQISKLFIALFAICNPMTVLPIFLTLCAERSNEEQRSTAVKAGIAAMIIFIVCTWLGTPILDIFGIDIPSFQVAGGLIVLLIALSMVQDSASRSQQASTNDKATLNKPSIAVVPLAIPLMAGPGAITTVIVAAGRYTSILDKVWISLVAILVAIIVGVSLYYADVIYRTIGQNGIKITGRVMGIILTAIAVSILREGLTTLFPGWAG